MKCVIYCRVSTDRQREAGTIESQRETRTSALLR